MMGNFFFRCAVSYAPIWYLWQRVKEDAESDREGE